MNIRCSKRCAKPVRPVFSRAEPTWYHMFVETSGTVWSSWRITVRPFDSVNSVYGSSIFGGAGAGACANAEVEAARAAAVRKVANFIRGDSTAIAPEGLLLAACSGLFRGTDRYPGRPGVPPRRQDVGDRSRQLACLAGLELERPEVQAFQHGRWRQLYDPKSHCEDWPE